MKSWPSTTASYKGQQMLELDIEGKLKLSFPAGWQATITSWNIVLLVTWAPNDFKRLARLLTTKMAQRLAAFGVACFALNEHELAPGQPWSVHRI